ncbi:MAG: hypothetical protein JW750_01890 [Anaerolineaceae bacterium]|nr:hypothetical protein [Anaerolineaceae bacterium]
MAQEFDRMEILQQFKDGKISLEEAEALLSGGQAAEVAAPSAPEAAAEPAAVAVEPLPPLEAEPAAEPDEEEFVESASGDVVRDIPNLNRFRNYWMIPAGIGLLITVLAALWMASGYRNAGLGWGFWLSWIPLTIGLIILQVGVMSIKSPWLHVRVKTNETEWPRRIAISLPLPLRLANVILRALKNTNLVKLNGTPLELDDISELLETVRKENEPISIHVDGDDGEQVDVFIG